jgi:hypothetical protein
MFATRLAKATTLVAALGIPDLIGDGSRSSADLAAATSTDPDALYRLLRTVAAAGVFEEADDRSFSLTSMGRLLRTDDPASLRDWAVYLSRDYLHEAWGNLEHSIRTGENSFASLHGENIWQYRAHVPGEHELFDGAMAALSRGLAAQLAEAYDFGRLGSLIDVGGGSGTILAAILARYPALRGIVFDQPEVVDAPATRRTLVDAGVADRAALVGGDFFERVPEGLGGYLMKAILHDWEDVDAIRILRTIRRAAGDASRLFVVEAVLGGPNTDLEGKLSDLNMLVMPGGRERSEPEWRSLLGDGGFRLDEVRDVTARWKLLIGSPA